MSIDFKTDAMETLRVNKDRMLADPQLIGDILIEDILIAMGYNFKHNVNIVKQVREKMQWIVTDGSGVTKIAALGLNEQPDDIDDYVREYDFGVFMLVTLGGIIIYNRKPDDEYRELNKLYEFKFSAYENNLVSEIEFMGEVFEYISNGNLDVEGLKKAVDEKTVSTEDLKAAMLDNIDNVVNVLMTALNIINTPQNIRSLDESLTVLCSIDTDAPRKAFEFSKIADEFKVQNSSLEAELQEAKDSILTQSEYIAKKEETLDDLDKRHDEAMEKISSLEATVEKLKEELVNSEEANKADNAEHDSNIILEYTSKIEELTDKNVSLQERISELHEKINVLQYKTDEASAKSQRISSIENLLSSIEDEEGIDREYVGVMNDILYRSSSLVTFIGLTIAEMYKCVSYKLMPVLFDGDIFQFSRDVVRKDFVINGKAYDIEIGSIGEEEALNKLVVLASSFDDAIMFKCKSIGEIHEPVVTDDATDSEEQFEELEEQSDFEQTDEETLDNSDFFDDTDGLDETSIDEEETDSVFEDEQQLVNSEVADTVDTEITDNVVQNIIKVKLSSLADILWSDDVEAKAIEYIGSDSDRKILFNIGKSIVRDEPNLAKMLSKTLDALIAMSNNFDESVKNIRNADLSECSAFITIINEQNKLNPKVSLSKYNLKPIDSLSKFVPILNGVADVIGIDKDTVDVYLGVEFKNSESILINSLAHESDLVCDYNDIIAEFDGSNIDSEEHGNQISAIISANITDAVIITQKSLITQDQLVEKCLAMKTEYTSPTVPLDTEDDIANAFEIIIREGIRIGSAFNISKLGNVIGEKHAIMSGTVSNVSSDYMTINVDGKAYNISKMKQWQLMYALIKTHQFICGDKRIGILVKINNEMYEYYTEKFLIDEPSSYLSVKSFSEYVNDRIKKA